MAEDKATTAKRNEDVIKRAVGEYMAGIFPPPPAASVKGLHQSTKDISAPVKKKEDAREPMSDMNAYTNGQYRALEARVDDLRGNYHDLRVDIDTRFSTMSAEIAKMAEAMNGRLDRLMEQGSVRNGGDFTRYGTILTVIAAVMTSVIGGFVTLENNSINSTISAQGKTQDANIARVEGQIDKLVSTTIPRPELDDRINGNRTDIRTLLATQVAHSTDIATIRADAVNLKSDVERLKTDSVKRADIEGKFDEYQNRLNLYSNRLSDYIKSAGGADIGQRVDQLTQRLDAFQNRFTWSPSNGPSASEK